MHQAHANTEAARKPREVKYYPDYAYNLNVTRFDSHGGWVGSPIDLERFLVRVDGLPTKPGGSCIIIAETSRAVNPSGERHVPSTCRPHSVSCPAAGKTERSFVMQFRFPSFAAKEPSRRSSHPRWLRTCANRVLSSRSPPGSRATGEDGPSRATCARRGKRTRQPAVAP